MLKVDVQGINQVIDRERCVLLGDITEMRIASGRGRARMTEQGLNMT